jgi:hypothetical protein
MQLIVAPKREPIIYRKSLFLGGGISNCRDWQKEVVDKFRDSALTIFNPRRVDIDINNPDDSKVQIDWEFRYLRESSSVMFYFCEETLCPITLFELGSALERHFYAFTNAKQKIFIGADAGYKRLFDIEEQSSRFGIKVLIGLDKTIEVMTKYIQ